MEEAKQNTTHFNLHLETTSFCNVISGLWKNLCVLRDQSHISSGPRLFLIAMGNMRLGYALLLKTCRVRSRLDLHSCCWWRMVMGRMRLSQMLSGGIGLVVLLLTAAADRLLVLSRILAIWSLRMWVGWDRIAEFERSCLGLVDRRWTWKCASDQLLLC